MFEGRAKIELFDSKTGEKIYEQEHKNIITNAYKTFFNPETFVPDIGIALGSRYSLSTITPLVDKIFGGILLFSENREQNTDNFMITKDDYKNFIGSAGNVWSGDSIYRGSLNVTESGKISNNEYKLVWDFPSHAANGKISCICLCPRYLGDSGLIKDPNDTLTTTLIRFLGYNLNSSSELDEKGSGIHYFHKNIISTLGYYVYSKDTKTNVYCRADGKKLYFYEISKKDTVGLYDDIKNATPALDSIESMNLYNISEPFEVDYTDVTENIQTPRNMQYYQGYFYFVSYKASAGVVNFKVFKINASDYTRVEETEYSLSIGDSISNSLYVKFINNKLYFTSTVNPRLVFIYDLKEDYFKTVEIPASSGTYETIKWYDTVAFIERNRHSGKAPIYILDSDDNICFNQTYINTSNYYSIFDNVYTNNETMKYPLCNASSTDYGNNNVSSRGQYINQLIMPFVSSINTVSEFTKNSSNTLKITYVIKEV